MIPSAFSRFTLWRLPLDGRGVKQLIVKFHVFLFKFSSFQVLQPVAASSAATTTTKPVQGSESVRHPGRFAQRPFARRKSAPRCTVRKGQVVCRSARGLPLIFQGLPRGGGGLAASIKRGRSARANKSDIGVFPTVLGPHKRPPVVFLLPGISYYQLGV